MLVARAHGVKGGFKGPFITPSLFTQPHPGVWLQGEELGQDQGGESQRGSVMRLSWPGMGLQGEELGQDQGGESQRGSVMELTWWIVKVADLWTHQVGQWRPHRQILQRR